MYFAVRATRTIYRNENTNDEFVPATPSGAPRPLPLRRYLVVHLKRFFFEGALRDKIETPVQFPLRTLDLSRRAARAA